MGGMKLHEISTVKLRRILHATERAVGPDSVEVADGGVIQPCDRADLWQVTFHGNGFLYKMVRNIVGTLADVTRGRTPEEELDKRLAAPAPFKGFTAPAHGLFLARVCY